MKRKNKRILCFVSGQPTEEQKRIAEDTPYLAFRNTQRLEEGSSPEQCVAVCGDVPKEYEGIERFDDLPDNFFDGETPEEEEEEEFDFESMKVDELKELLEGAEVDFDEKAKKAVLVELCKENVDLFESED